MFIEITDKTNYNSATCRNGGGYSFSTLYVQEEGGWRRSFSTSSELPWCSVDGEFKSCKDCPLYLEKECEPALVSSEIMLADLLDAIGRPGWEIVKDSKVIQYAI